MVFGLDTRRSFYKTTPIKINGFRIGVYGLNGNVTFREIHVDQPNAPKPTNVQFDLGYISAFYERVLYKSNLWELALPTQLGAGIIFGDFENALGEYKGFLQQPFCSINIGGQIKFYIFPWLAPKVLLGYRFIVDSTSVVKQAFDQPYYGVGVQILFGELYKRFFTPRDNNVTYSP